MGTAANLDQELQDLRSQVLSCDEDSESNDNAGETNKHSIKVCGIASNLKIIWRVAENFGVDLTSAKEHPNKEFQEDLRSLSRL